LIASYNAGIVAATTMELDVSPPLRWGAKASRTRWELIDSVAFRSTVKLAAGFLLAHVRHRIVGGDGELGSVQVPICVTVRWLIGGSATLMASPASCWAVGVELALYMYR